MPQLPHESREAQAAREAGRTDVRPGTARALSAGFLLMVLVVAGAEISRDLRRSSGSPWPELLAAPAHAAASARTAGVLAGNRHVLDAMHAFEGALEERSLVAERSLSQVQWALTRRLGMGSEQVIVGERGWLYFRAAVDHVTGPGFLEPGVLAAREAGGPASAPPRGSDPLPALLDFAEQLSDRGIGLVVVPTPVKASLHPEGLAPGLDPSVLPLENPSFEGFLTRLAEAEIPAFAPGRLLAEALRPRPTPLFLRTDTHWTPQAMEETAAGLAAFLRRHAALPERPSIEYRRGQIGLSGRGDLETLLRLPAGRSLFAPERVLTRPVVLPSGEPWRPDAGADILLLGDSFTNIYSQPELAWGEAAGFGEQLSYFLGRPVDKLAVNAGGPAAVRERLAALLAAGEDRLAGKRVVVYQFAERELSAGDWKLVDLSPGGARRGRAAGKPGEPGVAGKPGEPSVPAEGFAVWESNRSGAWRIWTRRLERSPPRQLTPDEPGLQHCCPHVSPDGSQLAYLSRAVPDDRYPELEIAGALRVLRTDGGGERELAGDARPYGWGNRAALWRSERELIYVDGEGRTRLLDVATGRSSLLTTEPRRELGWLLDSSLRHAVDGSPAFSSYDASQQRVAAVPRRPGCEPYFTHDGRFGYWIEGAGGPVRTIELQTGEVRTLLANRDPRIPGAQRYAYFPMVSRDGSLLAFGASPGDHDHFRSNYDIFVAPVDKASLQLLGRPLRLTAHPAVDRYPDVHVETLDLDRWRREAPPEPVAREEAAPPLPSGQLDVEARLGSCSRVPSLREISPYRAALIVCEWEVLKVLAGEPPADGRLRAAHWALRDGARQPISTAAQGQSARLRLEPLLGVAQIEGYPLFDTLPAGPRRPVYYAQHP